MRVAKVDVLEEELRVNIWSDRDNGVVNPHEIWVGFADAPRPEELNFL